MLGTELMKLLLILSFTLVVGCVCFGQAPSSAVFTIPGPTHAPNDRVKTSDPTQQPDGRSRNGEGDEDISLSPYLYLSKTERSFKDDHEAESMIAKFTKVITKGQLNVAVAYNNRAVIYADQGKYDLALADLGHSFDAQSTELAVLNNQGYVLMRTGDLRGAIAKFARCLEIDHGDVTALDNLVTALQAAGRANEALDILNRAIKANTKQSRVYNDRGMLYLGSGNLDAAQADFLKAGKLNSQFGASFANLAELSIMRGEWEKAVEMGAKAISASPRAPAGYSARGLAYRRLGKVEKALSDFNKAVVLDPRIARAYTNRAAVYVDQKDYSSAKKDADMAIQLDPKDPASYSTRADVQMGLKDFPSAIVDYTRALELDPKKIECYRSRAAAYDEIGDKTKASADRQRYTELGGKPEE